MIQPFCVKKELTSSHNAILIILTAKLRENIYSEETANLHVITSWLHS
jgi:hypothetical protein